MAEIVPSTNQEKSSSYSKRGTLAIDLGNTTTVVAFQPEIGTPPTLLDLKPISRVKGEIPSLVWHSPKEIPSVLVGQEVLQLGLRNQDSPLLCKDFKRLIGSTSSKTKNKNLSPEKAGELLLNAIWQRIPAELEIKKIVLTAPVETYRSYRKWLYQACESFPVDEIALVDEPTAAAMGAGLPPGSKLLVVDLGGSTIDFSLVALEGGEGRAEPVAQLLRFGGQNLEAISKQVLRCAKVLGKAGIQLGGRDFDLWIANQLFPQEPITEFLLSSAERLKCRLSKDALSEEDVLVETTFGIEGHLPKHLQLCRAELEALLQEKGLFKIIGGLLEETLARGRSNGCALEDLQGVVAVGGGAQIPVIRNWLKKHTKPAPFLTPPPIEAVAIGALQLTPGVTVRDVLQRGISLRCWDQKSKRHAWHPLFLAGQPWPTQKGLEIVLSASKVDQVEIELVIAEPDIKSTHEIIYSNGIPTIKDQPSTSSLKLNQWETPPRRLLLSPPGQPGEECLRLEFTINQDSNLQVQGRDVRNGRIISNKILGPVR